MTEIILHYFTQLNSGQFGVDYKGNDSNVEKAWLQGLSGCGVTVTVVDDGKIHDIDLYLHSQRACRRHFEQTITTQ